MKFSIGCTLAVVIVTFLHGRGEETARVRGKSQSILISDPHLLSRPLSSDWKNTAADQIRENDVLSAGKLTWISEDNVSSAEQSCWGRSGTWRRPRGRHRTSWEIRPPYASEQLLEEVVVGKDICFILWSFQLGKLALKGVSAVCKVWPFENQDIQLRSISCSECLVFSHLVYGPPWWKKDSLIQSSLFV